MARGDRKAVSFRSVEVRMQLSAATQGNRVIYEASYSWNATMLVAKYISPMLGLTPIYEISATLQPGTIYNQPRLSASKLSVTLRNGNFDPTSSLVRLQLAARASRARLSKDIPPIGGILTD